MRIGELASRAEVNVQTLRFYEREGLLRPPVRTASDIAAIQLAILSVFASFGSVRGLASHSERLMG